MNNVTEDIDRIVYSNICSYLWRDDGVRFSRNEDGTYSMDNSMMHEPHRYSFGRLMDTGKFSVYLPDKLNEENIMKNGDKNISIGIDMVKLQEVIVTNIKRRGNGEDDPIRVITQYWSKDGELLAEVDPFPVVDKYNELLLCVPEKVTGESRHQTALRQLQRANSPTESVACDNK
jgi:hypothetical protein